MRKLLSLILVVSFLMIGCTSNKQPALYPEKQITMIVPWAAGGGTDITARIFATSLEKYLGQKIVVVNKTGASGATGTEYVAEQPADGYTILFSADTIATFQCMGISKLGIDDFKSVMMISDDPKLVAVSKDSPYKTMDDLVTAAKANPGKLNLAYSGPGASGHLQGLMLKRAGLQFNMTPLGGGTAQIVSVLNGQSNTTNPSGSTVKDYLLTGDLVNLAMFSGEAVTGYEGIEPITKYIPELSSFMPVTFPVSIQVGKDTPDDIYNTILEACKKASKDERWTKFVSENSLTDLTDLHGDKATEYIKRMSSVYSWLLFDESVAPNNPEDYSIPRM